MAVVHPVLSGALCAQTRPRSVLDSPGDPPRTQWLINGYKEPVDSDFVAPSSAILRTDRRFERSSG